MRHIYQFLVFILFGTIVLNSCVEKDDSGSYSSEDSVLIFVDDVMNEMYLWNEEIPELDIFQYNSPSDLLEAMKYNPPDHWSFIDKKETIEAFFDEGEYFGFGFMLKFDTEGFLRVAFVYENSEAYDLGIRRGYIIDKLNGIPASLFNDYDSFFDYNPATFTFDIYDHNYLLHTITLEKSDITLNGVLYSNIYNVSGNQTGYLVYDSFLGYSQEELEEVIAYFKASNISELIVDLRYNGGGYISLAEEMCEIIMPADAVGKIFYSSVHNDNIGKVYNTTTYFSEIELNLDLDRVFFITTENSASASELVINSLEPHMEVITIGAPTHGKPVGMYGFDFQDWLLFPVTVQMLNADGYGDYFDGLIPDCIAEDDASKDWGDETEASLSQAFYYISNGTWNDALALSLKSSREESFPGKYWGRKNLLLLSK